MSGLQTYGKINVEACFQKSEARPPNEHVRRCDVHNSSEPLTGDQARLRAQTLYNQQNHQTESKRTMSYEDLVHQREAESDELKRKAAQGALIDVAVFILRAIMRRRGPPL